MGGMYCYAQSSSGFRVKSEVGSESVLGKLEMVEKVESAEPVATQIFMFLAFSCPAKLKGPDVTVTGDSLEDVVTLIPGPKFCQ